MSDTSARRGQLADAAITTLARAGMRGLTHRAVDQAAGLPEGSCSYYFRTRQALLNAAVERLVEVDTADLAASPAAQGRRQAIDEVADATVRMVQYWITACRERTLARFELMLEASRRPELQTVLAAARERFHSLARNTLYAIGATNPAEQAPVFIACLDGLMFRHLTGADPLAAEPADQRGVLLDLLRGFTRPDNPPTGE